MSNTKFKAAVFDLDGTLCTYGIGADEALRKAFQDCGFSHPLFSAEQYQEEFDNQFETAVKTKSPPKDSNQFRESVFFNILKDNPKLTKSDIQKITKTYTSIREGSLCLFEDCKPVLAKLNTKVKLALLTNGPSDLQWRKIKLLNLDSWFEAIIVSGDHGVSKPDPKIFQITLNKLHLNPHEAIYIGDTIQYDVVGAKSINLKVVWKNNDGKTLETSQPTPDYTINNLNELLTDGIIDGFESEYKGEHDD